MPQEIERKFLLANDDWKSDVSRSITLKQGYLNSTKERTVRIRVSGEQAFLTIKGPVSGVTRAEYEYEVPVSDGLSMINLCEQPLIEKTRHFVPLGDHLWEIDVFTGANEGLIVAEIELASEGESFTQPSWLGQEVSDDARYYNSSLIHHPFTSWSDSPD